MPIASPVTTPNAMNTPPDVRAPCAISGAIRDASAGGHRKDGQRGVDELCRQSGKRAAVITGPMESPFISNRLALSDASDLIDRFGDDAGLEAAVRAERSRDDGNVVRFCHWRQIERVIATLSSEDVRGTIH